MARQKRTESPKVGRAYSTDKLSRAGFKLRYDPEMGPYTREFTNQRNTISVFTSHIEGGKLTPGDKSKRVVEIFDVSSTTGMSARNAYRNNQRAAFSNRTVNYILSKGLGRHHNDKMHILR